MLAPSSCVSRAERPSADFPRQGYFAHLDEFPTATSAAWRRDARTEPF
jgi:hypothetical protein